MVWLELSQDSGCYHREGAIPQDEKSQGCFPFGITCFQVVLAASGLCKHIRAGR
jgi:hypothetical protein